MTSTEERVCSLDGCEVRFVPAVHNQKFCSQNHQAKSHTLSRRVGKFDSRICGWCENEYTPHREDQKYCSMRCSSSATNASRRGGQAQKTQEPNLELDNLRRELSLYEREWNAKPKWLSASEQREHHGTLIGFLSDTHYGEVVDPREVGGYNAYNLTIADKRTKRFFERAALVSRDYLGGVTYDGIVLALGGDIVSGDIHDELEQTNELSTYETVEWAIPRLKAGIELWLEEFGQVHVVSAPGNHGRNTQKPRMKKRSANNADTHIARLLAGSLDTTAGVTFDIPRGMDASFEVYGRRFSMEHGEEFRGGDGQVGALGPVKRGTLRKLMQTTMQGHPFECLLVGHFHQLCMLPEQGFVMNGSLKGADEYSQARHFNPEPPQQAFLVCTPEHGIGVRVGLRVSKREDEGW